MPVVRGFAGRRWPELFVRDELAARRANQRRLGKFACPVPAAKIFCFVRRANHFYNSRRPVPKEGRCATSSTREGMRWTRAAFETNAPACGRRSRMVLTPRRRRQVGGSNSAGDGDKKARSPGRVRNKLLKPSRAGMPGDPGATVVTNARAYYHYTRGCGCNGHPAFPAPLLG